MRRARRKRREWPRLSASYQQLPGRSFEQFWLRKRARATAWCKFYGGQLQKMLRHCQFFTVLTSKSLSHHSVVQIWFLLLTSWAADPPQFPFLRADFASLRSLKTMKKNILSLNSYPPKSFMSRICAVKHRCCKSRPQLSV